MLQTLPVELLNSIIAHLPSRKELRVLWRVSKFFRALLAAQVFEILTIRTKDDALLQLDKRPYLTLNARNPLGCLKLVKHLHLRAPFHDNLEFHRCPHTELLGPRRDPLSGLPLGGTYARIPKEVPLFPQLQENGLLSFSWDLGMCIPENIFGHEGYLTKKQTAIESLSLVTGTGFSENDTNDTVQTVVLSGFPKLRKFSWKGICQTEELDSLRDLLRCTHGTLEDLELDFIRWQDVTIAELPSAGTWLEEKPSFEELILPRQSNGAVKRFKSLTRLALSVLEFEDPPRKTIQAFNIWNLQSLKLHNCRRILNFLSTIVDSGVVLKIKFLELIIDDYAVEHDGVLRSPLISFLKSFQGLKHLYLMLQADMLGPMDWPAHYWNSILHHNSTLRRFIYHERIPRYSDYQGFSRETEYTDNDLCRIPPLWANELDRFLENHFYNTALAQMRLECFAIAGDPSPVRMVMTTPTAVAQNFKLLHLRRTGTDEQEICVFGEEPCFEDQIRAIHKHDPGSWSRSDYLEKKAERSHQVLRDALRIFQSPKFDNLQILAFGDFSHEGRYKGRHLLLCRAVTANPEVGFRVMSREDINLYKRSGLLSITFLAACSRETLLAKRDDGFFP